MPSKEELQKYIDSIHKIKPKMVFKHMDVEQKGMNFVIRYISEHQNKVYASEIAKAMNVSTARVAMLTNKLENKGLIKRETLGTDLRKTYFSLTNKGLELNLKREEFYFSFLNYIYDNVGETKMNDLIDILSLICKNANEYFLTHEHPKDFKEDNE